MSHVIKKVKCRLTWPVTEYYAMNPIDTFRENTEAFIGEASLAERLRLGKRLKVKLGVDPTRPDLTFGHMVVLNKLRQFQDLGHDCILLIGDYTATIGDPSGRSATRPVLTPETVRQNAESYLEQAFVILDEERTLVRYNSEWFNAMSFADCLSLARKMTVARMLERDDFAKRHGSGVPISLVEFLYPLVQGYDSVMLEADVELGGSDQLFNMLVGRALQKDSGQPEQAVLTMPLLVGLDGVQKMSKSADNYIAFNDPAKDMFGKVMSISDDTMWEYYRLLLEMDPETLARHRKEHPKIAKKHLASALVAQFHSLEAARHEAEQFDQVFARKGQPDSMPEFSWEALTEGESSISLIELFARTDLFPSKKEIRRLIEQNAVKADDLPIADVKHTVQRPAEPVVFQAGRRQFFRVVP